MSWPPLREFRHRTVDWRKILKILKVRPNPVGMRPRPGGRFVDAQMGYTYDPVYWTLAILVDHVPTRDDLYWREYPDDTGSTLIGLHADAYAAVLRHQKGGPQGNAGRETTLRMANGSYQSFVGLWDSSAPAAAGTGAPHLIDVALTDDADYFNERRSLTVDSQMVLAAAEALVADLDGFEIAMEETTRGTLEPTVVPV